MARSARRSTLASPETVEDILGRAGESRFARVRPPIASKLWREIVGARIAERAAPLSIYGEVLLLRVPSSVWAHELSLLTEDVCARLQQRGFAVRTLRFRVGSVDDFERPPERRAARAVPPTRVVPETLLPVLEEIDDAPLRRCIGEAIAANLAWQELTKPPPAEPVSGARRGARAPRSVEAESARPGRTSTASPATPPRTRGAWPDPRR
jgi:Dna[CI] antecedent, DciA